MRFAYADPPYLGCGDLYAKHHPDALVWNDPETHRALIARLVADYPDGWALSLSSPSLRVLLPMCPEDCRVMAWVKPFAVFKVNVGVAYAWEPVILRGGRRRTRSQPSIFDWIAVPANPRPGEYGIMPGSKRPPFVRWLLDVLNAQPGDVVDDLFPGTGRCGKVIAAYLMPRPSIPSLFAEVSNVG